MNILFIGYWGFQDGLTQSTIIPHLAELSSIAEVKKVVFCSIERGKALRSQPVPQKNVAHIPLNSKDMRFNFITKLMDFYLFPKLLVQIVRDESIDFMICRGSPAGALGYLVWRKTNIKFATESFEPHAYYMQEVGVWSKYDPRFILQKYWENQQKKHADFLIPVSNNYLKKLQQEGTNPERLAVVPCEVNLQKFRYRKDKRQKIRKHLQLAEHTTVGIYIGKFGDIYYDQEAFELFKKAETYFKDFFLIIGTPQSASEVRKKLDKVKFPIDKTYVGRLGFDEVPDYLSAADFAFSPIRSTPFRRYCSPIKNGEYWACGLPVLTHHNIGDDSEILLESGLGVVMEITDQSNVPWDTLRNLIDDDYRSEIRKLAEINRSPGQSLVHYQSIVDKHLIDDLNP